MAVLMLRLYCSMLRTPTAASVLYRSSISRTAQRSAFAASLGSTTTGVSRCGISSYIPSSRRLGSIMINRTSSGVARKRMLDSIALTLTDLPVPVDPAISRCGIVARSLTNGSPWMVLPSASVRREVERRYASDSSSSRREICSRLGFGIWMPTVDFPGMRSIRTDSACIARQRSSASPVILLYLTPASGLNS